MGAYYEVSAIVPLDPVQETEYRSILDQLASLGLKAAAYGDAHTIWINGADKMSHSAIGEIEDLLARLGQYATQAVRVATRYEDGDVEPLWIGPDKVAIVRAKIAAMAQHLAQVNEQLAALKEEERCLLQQSAAS